MADVSTWSTTPGSNNSSPPDGWPEGQAASTVNDCARQMMTELAEWYLDTKGSLTSTGSANAYVLTTNTGHATLAAQSLLAFRANFGNTGAATLAVDGLAAKSMRIRGAALASGDIVSGSIVLVSYNATDDVYDCHVPLPVNDASKLTTGTIPEARLSAVVIASPTNADARELGYRAVPQNAQTGAGYTLVLADAGKGIDLGSGFTGTVTIPANALVSFPIGSVVVIDNDSGGSRTVAITTDTLEDTAGNVGSRTLADNGQASIRKIAATKWRISGSGVS